MKGQSAGNQNHLWDEKEIKRRTGKLRGRAARELRRGERNRRGRR
jgi:hypothetical protein